MSISDLTPKGVITTRLLLLHFVPAELANQILDDAEYWPTVSSTFHPPREFQLAASRAKHFNATKCCLLTPKIPSIDDVPVKVRGVRFEINSHDQGWGGESLPGPYEGSYTWFEAVIVRAWRDEDGNENHDRDLLEMLEHREQYPAVRTQSTFRFTKDIPPTSLFFGLFGSTPGTTLALTTVKNPHSDSDSWPVQRNRRAQAVEQAHRLAWGQHVDPNLDEEAHFQHTGGYLGANFVGQLQSGDRIALLARAQFPMWVNHVCGASVRVALSV